MEQELRSQFSFYFSQANLEKDRYLGSLLAKIEAEKIARDNAAAAVSLQCDDFYVSVPSLPPWLDPTYLRVSIFLSFNAVKKIFEKHQIHCQKQRKRAIYETLMTENFTFIQFHQNPPALDEDYYFRLGVPLSSLTCSSAFKDTDQLTVFMESDWLRLAHIKHEDVIALLTSLGLGLKVTYLSLPKDSNDRNKGFCFIQLESKDQVNALLNSARVNKSHHTMLLSKQEWLKRKRQYQEYLKFQQTLASSSRGNKFAHHQAPLASIVSLHLAQVPIQSVIKGSYLRGTFFPNLLREQSQKSDLPAICYIDYVKRSNMLVLRMKNTMDAVRFVQSVKDWTSIKIPFGDNNLDLVPVLRATVMEPFEEFKYRSRSIRSKARKNDGKDIDDDDKENCNRKFDDDTENENCNRKRSHTFFHDEDDDHNQCIKRIK